MQKNRYYTDMADERVDEYKEIHNMGEIDGIEINVKEYDEFKITEVDITNENGAYAIDKEIGKYITIDMENVKYIEDKSLIIEKIKEQIKILMNEEEKSSVMIVGLGNEYVTPDALGSKVVKGIEVTRHILKLSDELVNNDVREVSAIAPNVMGNTGIETARIVATISDEVKPKYIIVIDSLMSKSIKRVGSSIQLSNTGITPGSGLSGYNSKIDKELTGANVICIGVPMVVDIATITSEAINIMNNKEADDIDLNLYYSIANILDSRNYIVTPKDIDEQVELLANIIYTSINNAM